MKRLLASAACLALLTGCATTSVPTAPVAEAPPVAPEPAAPPVAAAKPTPAEAKAFADDAETKLAALNEYAQHVQWMGATFINYDTEWLQTRADAALNEAQVSLALQAAKYNDVDVDAVTRRKLLLLRVSQVLPAAD